MHKGVILLVKASNTDEAKDKTQSFMSQYGDGDVWDWYVIGGRWSGTLNSKAKEFFDKAEEHFKLTYPDNKHNFISTKMVEEQTEALKNLWTEIGGEGMDLYARNQYADFGYQDDVRPLSECKDVVLTWVKDVDAEAEATWNKMLEAKAKQGHDMSPYYARKYADFKNDAFSFDTNVFDTETYSNNPTEAIENADQYFAVMVDMHN